MKAEARMAQPKEEMLMIFWTAMGKMTPPRLEPDAEIWVSYGRGKEGEPYP